MPSSSLNNNNNNNNSSSSSSINLFTAPPGGLDISLSTPAAAAVNNNNNNNNNNNDDDDSDDNTDDEMPPLETAPTVTSSTGNTTGISPSSLSSSSTTTTTTTTRPITMTTASRRIVRLSGNPVPLTDQSVQRIVRAIQRPTGDTETTPPSSPRRQIAAIAAALSDRLTNTLNNVVVDVVVDELDDDPPDLEEGDEREPTATTNHHHHRARRNQPANNHNHNNNNNRYAALEEEEEDDDDDNESFPSRLNDELMSYHSDDDDDDDNDDDDDDAQGMPPGLMDFFRVMAHVVERDSDDDEDDSGPCTCHHCLMERFGLQGEDGNDDNDEDSEDDDSEQQSNNNNNNTDQGTELETVLINPHASPCAVCMEEETNKRKFVELPCCGANGKAESSSTRFCHQCLVKYMGQTGIPLPPVASMSIHSTSSENTTNTTNNNNNNNNTNNIPRNHRHATELEVAGECPRCKHLLVLEASMNNNNNTNNNSNKKVHHKLIKAKTRHMLWYIAGKDSGSYRTHLLTVAWTNPHYIPTELLLNDSASEDKIVHLCQWGILDKVKTGTGSNPSQAALLVSQSLRYCYTKGVRTWHNIEPKLSTFLKTKVGIENVPWASTNDNTNNISSSSPTNSLMELMHTFNGRDQAETVYCMSPAMQQELCQLLLVFLEMDCDDDLVMRTSTSSATKAIQEHSYQMENAKKHCLLVALNCAASGWMAISQFRMVRAVRIWNRGLTLGLLSTGRILPWIGAWPRDSPQHYQYCWMAATALNVFLLTMACQILVQVIWIGWYLLQAYLVAKLVGSYFVPPNPVEWKRHARTAVVSSWLLYRLYVIYTYWQYWFPSSVVSWSGNLAIVDDANNTVGGDMSGETIAADMEESWITQEQQVGQEF